MADFNKTISNSINCFGPAPSTKWGTGSTYNMTWGTSLWGEGTIDLIVSKIKVITNDITPTDAVIKSVGKSLSNTIDPTFEADFESLSQGAWYIVFPKPTIDADERSNPTWSAGSSSSPTWSTSTASSPSWSQIS